MTIGKAQVLHERLKETANVVADIMGARDPDLDEILLHLHSAIEQGKTDFDERLRYRDLKERYEQQTRTPL